MATDITSVTSRKRGHINLTTKLAAALACLLPQEWRDLLREMRVSPEIVISHFQMDHVVLHCHYGSDEWWNLDPKLIDAHKKKSANDTSLAAKVCRLSEQHTETRRRILAIKKRPKPKRSRWGKRSLRK